MLRLQGFKVVEAPKVQGSKAQGLHSPAATGSGSQAPRLPGSQAPRLLRVAAIVLAQLPSRGGVRGGFVQDVWIAAMPG